MRSIVIFLSLLFYSVQIVSQDLPLRTQEILQEYLDLLPNKAQIAIGIIHQDQQYTIGYEKSTDGLKKIDNAYAIYEIGSITKTMTAGLVQQFRIQQKIDLNHSIFEFLPDHHLYDRKKIEPIQFKHMLTHTSGISTAPITILSPILRALIFRPKNPNKYVAYKHYHNYLKKYELEYEAGEKWEYNNGAYGLLGHILAHQQQSSWDSLMHQQIFEPLQMNHSYATGTYVQKNHQLIAYTQSGKKAKYWDMNLINAAGSVKSCSHDMLRWLQAHLDASDESWLGAMKEEYHVPTAIKNSYSGSGWMHLYKDNAHYIWHGGATGGYRSFSAFDPVHETAIVILINMNSNHQGMKNQQKKSLIRIYGFELLESLADKSDTVQGLEVQR